jgi:hypothetical protein
LRHYQAWSGSTGADAHRTDRRKRLEVTEPQGLDQPPISTVGQPGGMTWPTGEGIGATQEA